MLYNAGTSRTVRGVRSAPRASAQRVHLSRENACGKAKSLLWRRAMMRCRVAAGSVARGVHTAAQLRGLASASVVRKATSTS